MQTQTLVIPMQNDIFLDFKDPCYPKGTGFTAKNAYDPHVLQRWSVGSLDDKSDNASTPLPPVLLDENLVFPGLIVIINQSAY